MSARDERDDFFWIDFRSPAFDDLPASPEDGDPVRNLENIVHVVADKNYGPPTFGETPDELKDLARFRDRKRCRRLIHDNESRIEVERARDCHRLTLSAGKASDRRVGIRDVRFKRVQKLDNLLLHRLPSEKWHTQNAADELSAEKDILRDRQIL